MSNITIYTALEVKLEIEYSEDEENFDFKSVKLVKLTPKGPTVKFDISDFLNGDDYLQLEDEIKEETEYNE